MANITQTISTFPTAPDSSTDTPTEFNSKADAFVNHQSAVYVGEVNQWATEANGLKSDMNQVKADIDNIVATIPDGSIDDVNISPTNVFSSQKTEATYAKKGSLDADTFQGRELDDFRGKNLGSNTQDPNLASEHIIVSKHANTPDPAKFWNITTTFYNNVSGTASRGQMAISYFSTETSAYVRNTYNSTWTPWVELSSAGGTAQGKNILINPNLTINQRDITTLPVSGEYWYDRWRSTGTEMVQVVEDGSYVPNATYTYSGVGITTHQITAPASGDWVTTAVPSTARELKLELGTVATPFEPRPVAEELALCQRYYSSGDNLSLLYALYQTGNGIARHTLAQTMRTVPTVTQAYASTAGAIHVIGTNFIQWINLSVTSSTRVTGFTADAEIY